MKLFLLSILYTFGGKVGRLQCNLLEGGWDVVRHLTVGKIEFSHDSLNQISKTWACFKLRVYLILNFSPN